jgi:PAS domain S-box-containing protein
MPTGNPVLKRSLSNRYLHLIASVLTLAFVFLAVLRGWFGFLLSTDYLPHRYCYLAKPGLIWSNVAADSLIALAYLAISVGLAYLFYKLRRDLPFHWMFLAFGLFIVACAGTHFMEVVTVWVPLYVLSAGIKIFTAIVSVATAAVLPSAIPQVIALIREAKAAEVQRQVLALALEERDFAQKELSLANTELERKVHDRTMELEVSNFALQAEIEDRSRIEKQLVKLASIVEYSNDAIYTKTLDGIVTTWNKAAEHTYGYKTEEIIGKSVFIFAPEDRNGEISGLLSKIVRGEIVENYETIRVKKDGSLLDVSLTVSPVRNLTGEITGASVIARDITEQKQAEAALRQSHKRLQNILDNIFTFVGLLSTDGILMEVNRAPLEVSGLRREDVIGKYVTETYWFSHSKLASDRIRDAIHRAAQGEIVRFDETIRATGDQLITIDLTYSPLRDDAGEVIQIVGSAVDITDRKRAESALVEAAKQYRLLFNGSPLPMWVFDHATLAFLAVNDAAIRHYGFSREEFLAMTILDIRPEEDIPTLLTHISDAKEGLQPPEIWRHRKKDGSTTIVEITSHELAFEGRNAQLVLANDVTERLKAEADLRHSEEKFSKTFRSSPLPITISIASDGQYIDVNDAFLKIMEYQR